MVKWVKIKLGVFASSLVHFRGRSIIRRCFLDLKIMARSHSPTSLAV